MIERGYAASGKYICSCHFCFPFIYFCVLRLGAGPYPEFLVGGIAVQDTCQGSGAHNPNYRIIKILDELPLDCR
jgi:hypothetical protein